jgi:hypothetical protein
MVEVDHPVVTFESEEARRLADCASITQDLTFVVEVTKRLLTLY